jgi:hypothetical protein
MNKPVATAYTETAWDALQDGMELVLRLFSEPLSTADLAAATGEPANLVERKLARLEKTRLLRRVGGRWEVVAQHVHQTRQEGMVTSLTRYVLPSLTRAAREPGAGYLEQIDLCLAPEDQVKLRENLWRLSEDLNEISLRTAEARVACCAVVVGTSDVPLTTDPAEKMLESVRRAARQRATPEAADRAVLRQFDGLFGTELVPEAEQVVRAAADGLRVRACQSEQRPTYTLLLGFFVRGRTRAVGGDDEA